MKRSENLSISKLDGIINVFKEPGYTSHDVVAILRRILGTKKIGHAGTLDPNVSGVLPICINKGTKISDYLMDFGKTYIGEITFGIETDTEDIWGNITKTSNIEPNMKILSNVFNRYNNIEIKQKPPMYSAVKVKGKKLYELARKGIEVERKERSAFIYETKVLRIYNNRLVFLVRCSKGTYIRTFIKDLCLEAGTIGTMSNLIRVESGGLNIKQSITLSQVEYLVNNDIWNFIKPIDESLVCFKKVDLPEKYFKEIINGVKIKWDIEPTNDLFLIYCSDIFIGIGEFLEKDGKQFLKIKNMFYRGLNENN